MTSNAPLQKEFEFYLSHQKELVEKYDGKVIVIKDGEVLAAYDDELAAVMDTQKTHELGTFLIQRVSEGEAGYSQTYHSRVVLS